MKSHKLYFLLILCIAGFLRFYNLNWDSGFHLHPDERFLTMVGNAMKLPNDSHTSYFNPKTSTMNPMNVGYQFFVYGTFPLILNKLLAVPAHTDNYNDFTIQGRFISGFADLLIVLVIYKITQLFTEKYKWPRSVPLWASFFYAIAVLPIQLSHFFAVDTFLSLFMISSFYFALKTYYSGDNVLHIPTIVINLLLSAISIGLAVSCKVNAVFILPLNLLFFFLPFVYMVYKQKEKKSLLRLITVSAALLLLYIVGIYITVRLANPYYFESSSFLDATPNKLFVQNIKSLKSFEGKDVWFPPAVQWMSKEPVIYSIKNLALIGLGLPNFLCMLVGLIYIFLMMKKKSLQLEISVIILWVGGFFLYQSTQFVKALRYFIFIYPFLAIFAGIGIAYIVNDFRKRIKNMPAPTIYVVLILLLISWPLAFMSIYVHKNSRVEASEWIFKNLENDSLILTEHWDDGLPLPLVDTQGKIYRYEQLPVFDPDTDEKWSKMNDLLHRSDYYILTSNRGWGSIPTVPDKYPRMTKYYSDLFANKSEYTFIKRYSSYPSLRYLGIPVDFPDQWADETFTVYDHPEVNIFKNTKK